MNRIAAMTVIRGEGECQAYMNSVVQAEIRRQQAKMRAEIERYRTVEASRNQYKGRDLAEINRQLNRRPNVLKRFFKPVGNAWAMLWAVLHYWPEMLLNLCIKNGLLDRI